MEATANPIRDCFFIQLPSRVCNYCLTKIKPKLIIFVYTVFS